MLSSIAGRLALLTIVPLALVLAAATVASLRAANANVTALVTDELNTLERVVLFALEEQRRELRERVAIVAADYAFKEAMATGERGTVLSALANHGERLAADLAVLLNADGELTLSSIPGAGLETRLRALTHNPTSSLAGGLELFNAGLYRIAIRPIEAPNLIGWLVLGEALDRNTLSDLKALTGAEVSLLASQDGKALPTRTTLPMAVDETPEVELQDSGWLNHRVTLRDGDGVKIDLLLSLSLADALRAYDPLRFQLIGIGVIALALVAMLAIIGARFITRPVAALVTSARRISQGDYTRPLQLHSGTELDDLAKAMSFMQETVAEREARIQFQAEHDLLTRLPNRNHLYQIYLRYLATNPERSPCAIVLLELENLPQLQDLYGASFSDRVLQQTSQRIIENLRSDDIAARVGDRQLLLFFRGLRQRAVEGVVAAIRQENAEQLVVEDIPVRLELRLGFAFSPDHGVDFDDLQRRAQLALGAARSSGTGYAVYAPGQDEKHLRQIGIAGRLERAVAENAFSVLYQPKYSLTERRVTGAEALLRWHDPELGAVFPDEFIPVAEQTGLITRLSTWVMRRALRDLAGWQQAGHDISVCINLSSVDVLNEGFLNQLMEEVSSSGVGNQAVVLEITETSMMADLEQARTNLTRLSDRGLRLSIDDYGTGFSSLAQLRSLPVSELKLDRSLVADIDTEEEDRLIVRSTIEMAHLLDLTVVAEGVESPSLLKALQEMRCDTIQGYLLAKPLRSEDLLRMLPSASDSIAFVTARENRASA